MRSKWGSKKIGVLLGGTSKEREISLKTGAAIAGALKRKGYSVMTIDCGLNVQKQIEDAGIDAAFIALHGNFGEDGQVQRLLEKMKIPYTGSGPETSALAMDKVALNRLCRQWGMTLPQEEVFEGTADQVDSFLNRFSLPLPVIVKPSREGSSINLTVVRHEQELKPAVLRALQSDSKVLLQQFIEGKEVTVSVLNGKALPSIEIIPHNGLYDYESKYTKGKSDYIIPARVSEKTQSELSRITEEVYRKIGGRGFARVDFIVDIQETPYFLELNTIPGMTETSLVPKAAKAVGIEFDDLCEAILETLQ